MSSWTYEQYGDGWAASSYVFDGWDDKLRFPSREAAEQAVNKYLLEQTEDGRKIIAQQQAKTFWNRAKCTHSYKAHDKRAVMERARYGSALVRVRRWKDPETGSVRRTVEIELDDD